MLRAFVSWAFWTSLTLTLILVWHSSIFIQRLSHNYIQIIFINTYFILPKNVLVTVVTS